MARAKKTVEFKPFAERVYSAWKWMLRKEGRTVNTFSDTMGFSSCFLHDDDFPRVCVEVYDVKGKLTEKSVHDVFESKSEDHVKVLEGFKEKRRMKK